MPASLPIYFNFATWQIKVSTNQIIHKVIDKVKLKIISSQKGECGLGISKKPMSL